MSALIKRLGRFVIVGGAMTGLNLGLLALLVEGLRLPYLWACVASFAALNLVGYRLNKGFTFRLGTAVRWVEVARYYAVMGFSLALNLGLMHAFVEIAQLHYLLASLLVTSALVLLNFAGHSVLTFQTAPDRSGARLRVLQVSAFFPRHGGGIEAVAGALARGLGARGVDIRWMAGGTDAEWPAPDDFPDVALVPVHSFDPLEARLGLPWPLWSGRALLRLAREVQRADVVHLHDVLYLPTLAAAFFAALMGRQTVVTQHIGMIPFGSPRTRRILDLLNRSVGRLVLGRADLVAFVGRPVMDYFLAFTHFRAAPRLIPNGVDHKVYRSGPGSEPSGPLDLLFVGRFVEKKGISLLKHSAAIPGVRWTYVGHGPLTPRAWARPAAEIQEQLRGAEVAAFYRRSDLLVLPSTGEGFPLVVQEALACGTPVLVSSEVASAFPMLDERCVFQVELAAADPAEALRTRLEEIVASPATLRSARPYALALASQWSWAGCVDAYLGLYVRLAGSREFGAPCPASGGQRPNGLG